MVNLPALFIGHGSPMNAIHKNSFTETWKILAEKIPKPSAIICISAHYETMGTKITANKNQKTIHDFGGFPKELYNMQYPASGNPELARRLQKELKTTKLELDEKWGLDHGTWSVLVHMYPNADIPVLQLSLDRTKPPEFHFALGKELSQFRNQNGENILFLGSGNIVHNFQFAKFSFDSTTHFAHPIALKANEQIINQIQSRDYATLLRHYREEAIYQFAAPTPEHFLPLFYILGMQEPEESVSIYNNQVTMGGFSMASLMVSSLGDIVQ